MSVGGRGGAMYVDYSRGKWVNQREEEEKEEE